MGQTTLTKISVEDLRLGMYVCDIDRPWLETPFLFQGFEVCTQEEIEELKRYCKEVYIGADVNDVVRRYSPRSVDDRRRRMSFFTDSQKKLEFELLKKANAPNRTAKPCYTNQTTLEEEVAAITHIYEESTAIIKTVMQDARFGKSLDIPGTKKVVGQMAESVIRNPDALMSFAQLKKKDEYTALHSLRVCILALTFGRHLGFDLEQLYVLGIGALLQDVGKMRIPDEILKKPGPLTEQEFTLMKSHVPRGVTILASTKRIPQGAIEIVERHHERCDGSGYMNGLRGDEIGIFGTIGGLVDCYDALTSDRPHQASTPAHIALRKLYEWRDKAFDKELAQQFIECMGIYPIGSVVKLNTGEVGVVITTNRVRRLRPKVTLVLKPDRTPYATPKTIDLMRQSRNGSHPAEIDQVLEPHAYDIDPVTYLPLTIGL
jgi:HD-GYP domain-containing protein (c-di-GMP phosphodiesterase class II)